MASKTEIITSVVTLFSTVTFCLVMVQGLKPVNASDAFMNGAVAFFEQVEIASEGAKMAEIMPAAGEATTFYAAAK